MYPPVDVGSMSIESLVIKCSLWQQGCLFTLEKEVRQKKKGKERSCNLCYLDSGTDVGYWYMFKCRIRLNIQFYA